MFQNQITNNKNISQQNLSQAKDLKIDDLPIHTMAKDLEEIEHPKLKTDSPKSESAIGMIDTTSLNEKQKTSPFLSPGQTQEQTAQPKSEEQQSKAAVTAKTSFFSSLFGSSSKPATEKRIEVKQLPEQKETAQRIADAQKAAETQKVEAQKVAEQKMAEQKMAEQKAEERRLLEQKAIAEKRIEEQKAEEKRLAEVQKMAEQQIAQQKTTEEQMHRLQAKELQKLNEQRMAQQQAEEKILMERRAETEKIIALQRSEEKRLMEQRAIAEQKMAEQKETAQRIADAQKAAETQKVEAQKVAEQKMAEQKAEEKHLLEQKTIAEKRIEEQKAEEKRLAEAQRATEQKIAQQKNLEAKRLRIETISKIKQNIAIALHRLAPIAAVALVISIIGAGFYYFSATKQVEPTITTPEPISNPVVPPIAEPVATKSELSTKKPNYLQIDIANATALSINNDLRLYALRIKDAAISSPVEFIVTDLDGNPVDFATFASKSGIKLSLDTMSNLDKNFSLFIMADASRERIGLAINSINSTKLKLALLNDEPNLTKGLEPILLSSGYTFPITPFGKNIYKGFEVRYQNITSQNDLSIDYTFNETQLLISTTRIMLESIIDKLTLQSTPIASENSAQ